MSDDIAIIVENLTKTYRLYNSNLDRLKESLHPLRKKYHHEFNALHNVSFEIIKGESVGIIGKNGSGKSTLLKLITGVLTPTSGTVTVNGKISALLELGSGFNPELTGIENVYFNGTLMGYSRDEMDARLDAILAFADIGEFVYQPVKSYSSGMFVRLAFAVAINVDPDILIVDEALSVGDIKFQRKCYSKIENFKDIGKTIIFVTHDTGSINNLCSKAMLLNNGELLAVDMPRVVTKKYVELIFDFNSNAPQAIEEKEVGEDPSRLILRKKVLEVLNLNPPANLKNELRHGTGKTEIIDFGIKDMNGMRVNRLISGQKYIFYFVSINYEPIKDLYLAFLVRNVQGIELFITNNELNNISLSEQDKHSVFEVNLEISAWLAQGEYFLSFVTMDKTSSIYTDRRLDAYYFTVIDEHMRVKGYVNLMPSMSVITHDNKFLTDDISTRYKYQEEGFHGDRYLIDFSNYFLNRCKYFVETGANVGTTLAYVSKLYPEKICYSCEPDEIAYKLALNNALSEKVTVYNETAQLFLQRLNRDFRYLFDEEVVFWLDAHGYGFEWPLRYEIDSITTWFNKGFIFIDDFKVPDCDWFGYDSYEGQECSFDYIKGSLNKKRKYKIYYPRYKEKTSTFHPLRGWCLIYYGEIDLDLPEGLLKNVNCCEYLPS